MKSFLMIVAILFVTILFGQKTIHIEGFAPKYVGQRVLLNSISDYLTDIEHTICTAEVKDDSTFSLTFSLEEAQKLNLYVGKNSSFLYVQPGGEYSIYFPERDRIDPPRPMGNKVELRFGDLDSNDINERIIIFNNSLDNFLYKNFKKSKTDPVAYNKTLDEFKNNVANYFKKDTGNYVYDYIRFSLALIDDLPQAGNRNKYEKFDFYLKYSPVLYTNDAYMKYVKAYFAAMVNSLPMERNNEVYMGVVKSSPTLIMRALGKEYTLSNIRLRELVMIQALGEMYFRTDYPQTNVIAVLDSLEKNALFSQHRNIASNMKMRLTEITNGGKAPDFVLKNDLQGVKTLGAYKGRYIYFHFFDPSTEQAMTDLILLANLQKKYHQYVDFVTVVPKSASEKSRSKEVLEQIKWDLFVEDDFSSSIWKNYKVESFPYFVLIDPHGYVVQAPALTPRANAMYETIDRTFFEIKKVLDKEQENKLKQR